VYAPPNAEKKMCNNFVDVASNANAARDRDGSNSPAWWSELNSNFGAVWKRQCA